MLGTAGSGWQAPTTLPSCMQAGEMEALRAEIAMLRRKGGVTYATAPALAEAPTPFALQPPAAYATQQPQQYGGGTAFFPSSPSTPTEQWHPQQVCVWCIGEGLWCA